MATDFGFEASKNESGYYFVSYNSEDSDRVAEICRYLHNAGVDLWYDEGIQPGRMWKSVIGKKIRNSSKFIIFITKSLFVKAQRTIQEKSESEVMTYLEYEIAKDWKEEDEKLIVILDEWDIIKENVPEELSDWFTDIKSRHGIFAAGISADETAVRILKELGLSDKLTFSSSLTTPNKAKKSWGPERKMFTMKKPASYPVMNSIIDNPTIGDERAFIRIGKITNRETVLSSKEIEIEPGNRYLVYIYCHNACSATFFDKSHQYSGAVTGLKLSSGFPESVGPNINGEIFAKLSADNTNPREVWKTQKISSATMVNIKLESPAKIYNDWELNGSELPMDLFTKNGTFLGTDELDGIMFGEESHCVVKYILAVTEKKDVDYNKIARLSKKLDEHR